jgi:hypothetical protein
MLFNAPAGARDRREPARGMCAIACCQDTFTASLGKGLVESAWGPHLPPRVFPRNPSPQLNVGCGTNVMHRLSDRQSPLTRDIDTFQP